MPIFRNAWLRARDFADDLCKNSDYNCASVTISVTCDDHAVQAERPWKKVIKTTPIDAHKTAARLQWCLVIIRAVGISLLKEILNEAGGTAIDTCVGRFVNSTRAATPHAAQEEAIAEIERLGGKVGVIAACPGKPALYVDFHDTNVSDAGLANLKGLTQLEKLEPWLHQSH